MEVTTPLDALLDLFVDIVPSYFQDLSTNSISMRSNNKIQIFMKTRTIFTN